ncbi:MAG: STM3941 family protein [Fimbriimonadaceae bacterium]
MSGETVIGLSRSKLLNALVIGGAFAVGLVWFGVLDERTLQSYHPGFSFAYRKLIGLGLGGGLALFLVLVIFPKLLDKGPGLILTPSGILDKTGPTPTFIAWLEVLAIQASSKTTGAIYIQVEDPDRFLKQGNLFVRYIHWANLQMLRTPIVINTKTLELDEGELLRLLQRSLQEAQESSQKDLAPAWVEPKLPDGWWHKPGAFVLAWIACTFAVNMMMLQAFEHYSARARSGTEAMTMLAIMGSLAIWFLAKSKAEARAMEEQKKAKNNSLRDGSEDPGP